MSVSFSYLRISLRVNISQTSCLGKWTFNASWSKMCGNWSHWRDYHIIEYSCKMLTEAHGFYPLHSSPASTTRGKLPLRITKYCEQRGIRIISPKHYLVGVQLLNDRSACTSLVQKCPSKVFLVGNSFWFHDHSTHLKNYIHYTIISVPAMKYFFSEVTPLFCYYLFMCRLLIKIASLTAFGLPVLTLSFENQ